MHIPQKLTDQYALAQRLGLELPGFPEGPVQDEYPAKDCFFWDAFIEQEIRIVTKTIAKRLHKNHIHHIGASNKATRHQQKAINKYIETKAYKNALDKALRGDTRYLKLKKAQKGDPELMSAYKRFHREAAETRIAKQRAVLERVLGNYRFREADHYIEELITENITLESVERIANKIIHIIEKRMTTEKIYIPDFDGNYNPMDCRIRMTHIEIHPQFLAEELTAYGRKELALCLFQAATGLLDYQAYAEIKLTAKINKDTKLKNILPNIEERESHLQNHADRIYDLICSVANIDEIIAEYFTREKIMSLLSMNPKYENVVKACDQFALSHVQEPANEYEQRRRVKEEKAKRISAINQKIMESIPTDYKDLYPAARSMKRKFILHVGPTNSGKTFSALEAYRNADTGVYLGPLRLLAYEIYENTNAAGVPCSMITGEEELVTENAQHFAKTIEMLQENEYYDVAVIDEGQMIGDRQRGGAWTEAILGLCAEEIHICMAPEAKEIIIQLIEICGDEYEVVEHKRFTPLKLVPHIVSFPRDVQEGDALIVFSRNAVLEYAEELKRYGIPCSMIYGTLPYDVRRMEVAKFMSGETKVVVATDAIGMGLNLPVKRIVFLASKKYDGITVRELKREEILQIAGRAGRYGVFEEGEFATTNNVSLFQSAIMSTGQPLTGARVSLPRRLVSVEGSLEEIITCWDNTRVPAPFIKENLSEARELSGFLEKYTTDKGLVYSLITIPFNERNVAVKRLWETIAIQLCLGSPLNWNDLLYYLLTETECQSMIAGNKLEVLEEQYQICDLLHYFNNRFSQQKEEKEQRRLVLMEQKEMVSKAINIVLTNRQKKRRPASKRAG